jgi:hypothetical protein
VADRSGTAWSLINLGEIALAQGSYQEARTLSRRGWGLSANSATVPAEQSSWSLGRVALLREDLEEARSRLPERSTDLHRLRPLRGLVHGDADDLTHPDKVHILREQAGDTHRVRVRRSLKYRL